MLCAMARGSVVGPIGVMNSEFHPPRRRGRALERSGVKLLRVFEGNFGLVWYRLGHVVPRHASIDWK
jgi:hypothetical protein